MDVLQLLRSCGAGGAAVHSELVISSLYFKDSAAEANPNNVPE